MAKGTAMGLWRGKKGSTVFYKLTNSNNAQKQGIRERVYEVANPQSNGQATQRAKLLPAQRVAGVIREIVERGWQGVDYGSKSRSEFLKRALSMKSGYPFIVKDDDRIVPGAYQITKGTLSAIQCAYDDSFLVNTNILLGSGNIFNTWGEVFQAIIDNNANIQEGDQITCVVCASSASTTEGQLDANYTWSYSSMYVDPSNTDLPGEGYGGGVAWFAADEEGGYITVAATAPDDSSTIAIAAVAVIVSRLGDNGQHLRSTAKLLVNDDLLSSWFSSAQQRRARESYQTANAATTNTNWPVDGDADQIEGTYQSTLTLAGLTGDLASANGQEILVRKRESDDTLTAVYYKIGVISESACVVKSDGSFISVGSSVENRHELRVSECPQVSDLPQILYQ